jgi:hypothetical protein
MTIRHHPISSCCHKWVVERFPGKDVAETMTVGYRARSTSWCPVQSITSVRSAGAGARLTGPPHTTP